MARNITVENKGQVKTIKVAEENGLVAVYFAGDVTNVYKKQASYATWGQANKAIDNMLSQMRAAGMTVTETI